MNETKSDHVEILLVEDNPADVQLVRGALEETGVVHRLNVACDGEEALEFMFRRGRHADAPVPDLVLLDLNLPLKTGDDVLKELREHAETSAIPVIILSSSAAPKDVRHAYELHANGYVRKPRDLDGIYRAIGSLKHFWFEVAELPGRK